MESNKGFFVAQMIATKAKGYNNTIMVLGGSSQDL